MAKKQNETNKNINMLSEKCLTQRYLICLDLYISKIWTCQTLFLFLFGLQNEHLANLS